jgi:hypothetical protein
MRASSDLSCSSTLPPRIYEFRIGPCSSDVRDLDYRHHDNGAPLLDGQGRCGAATSALLGSECAFEGSREALAAERFRHEVDHAVVNASIARSVLAEMTTV